MEKAVIKNLEGDEARDASAEIARIVKETKAALDAAGAATYEAVQMSDDGPVSLVSGDED